MKSTHLKKFIESEVALSKAPIESEIPDPVLEVLRFSKIGYLSVTSKKGDLYSYPVAYHYSSHKIFLMTPIASAKMKFMKANPSVSFLVDNKKLALEACGAMVQGKAKILSMAKMIATVYTIGPKSLLEWSKKYPGLLSFYAKGKDLPEERKLYKYRFIKIEPSKIVYWTGYSFGKYVPSKNPKSQQEEAIDKSNTESLVNVLANVDEDLEPDKLPADEDWLSELSAAVSDGIISEDEKRVIGMYKNPIGIQDNPKPGKLSEGEKNILKKWKESKTSN